MTISVAAYLVIDRLLITPSLFLPIYVAVSLLAIFLLL
jgi:hypothetical protein